MAKLIAYCGLNCGACNAYIATQRNDAEMIERTAREWSEMYHTNITADSVWCDGCTVNSSRHCGHCSECGIRACAQERNVANCGSCPQYGCETIATFMELVPDVKTVLDRIHKGSV
jgi:hypothetical protein